MRALSLALITMALAMPALAADEDAAPAMSAVDDPRMAPGGVIPQGFPAVGRGGPGLLFASVADTTAATQVFRFTNGGRAAATVTATLYDAAAGTSLGTWTSASIPAGAAIEVTAASVESGLTAAQRANPINIAVSVKLEGTAQLLSKTASAIINQSDCGAGGSSLGYVEGPGFVGATGALRLVNGGAAAGTITLSLRDAATGTVLGKYTSASVPAHGAVTVTTAAMAAAATPVVPATTVALSIVPTAATARIEIEHLASVTASMVVSNLSAACGL